MQSRTQSGRVVDVVEDSEMKVWVEHFRCVLYIGRIIIDDFWGEPEERVELVDARGIVVESASLGDLDGHILDADLSDADLHRAILSRAKD